MGMCSRRYFFVAVCVLQLVTVVERQVFDFLGYLWIPILVNFFEIIFVIFGLFGALQYTVKYLLAYSCFNLFWLGWNSFMICLYLDLAGLNHKSSKILKLDPGSGSWWQNGPGCKGTLNTTVPFPVVENVTNCLVNYQDVEVFQAGLQCILALTGIVMGFCLCRLFADDDDDFDYMGGDGKGPQHVALQPITQNEHRVDTDYDVERVPPPISPRPMTPRRVKRRSVMTRGTASRQSTGSRRHTSGRSSTRSSRRSVQNPVTRLLEQQQKIQAYGREESPSGAEMFPNFYSGSESNILGHGRDWQSNGHANPTYQQSSTQSLNEADDLDELYNNRPASVRSSYSNFHGTRAINYGVKYQHGQATPQVPQKRSANPHRSSMRSVAFFNNGPPAYNAQGNVPLDSETTI